MTIERLKLTTLLTIILLILPMFVLSFESLYAQESSEIGDSQHLEQGPVTAQPVPAGTEESINMDNLAVMQEITSTPSLQLTTAGWVEAGLFESGNISASALAPVNCTLMSPPVVGYEISKGQNPDDIVDFINDLQANGFRVGSVNISGGVNPPDCVDVLIVLGSAGGGALPSPYTPAEGGMLRTWASAGHGLMVLGDWGIFKMGTEALFQAYNYSQQGSVAVSDPTDFDAAGPSDIWVIYQQADNFTPHPILNGITSLEILASSWLAPTTNAIVTTDTDATPPGASVMAAFNDIEGCVALIADTNWIGTGGYAKLQNATVARQMVEWLNGCSTLKLQKSASPNPVLTGQIVTYIITATNHLNPSVTNVLITDTVPVSTTFVSASTPHSGPDANQVVSWSLGTLNFSASAVVTMAVRVDVSVPDNTIINNTAWITSSQGLSDRASASVIAISSPLAEVTGIVWQDLNGNGIIEVGEPFLPNITVVVTDSLGILRTLVTNANGRYITTVPSGTVTIDIDQFDIDLAPNSALTTANDPVAVTVVGGGSDGANFGFQTPSTVTGIVWHDLDGNGNIGSAEPVLPNITVIITDGTGITQSLVTGTNGRYITTVPSGTVTIDVDQADSDLPTNSILTTVNDPSTVIVLTGGFAGVNFGFLSIPQAPPPVPPPAPPPPAPPPPDSDDDDDDGAYVPAPTATPLPPPSPPVIIDPVPTEEPLPAKFLPDTGSRADKLETNRTRVGLAVLLLLSVIGIAARLIRRSNAQTG